MTRPLTLLRWHAFHAIDQKAAEVRLRFTSEYPGQHAVLLTKLQEAQAFLAARALNAAATPGPHIAAEAARRSVGPVVLANAVVAAAADWLAISPAIEAERTGGKQDVRNASTEQDIETARAACLAALDALQS